MAIEILAAIDAVTHPKKFFGGVVLWDDKVIEAAPCYHFMKRQRWTRDRVRAYCAQQGWKISVVHQMEVQGYGKRSTRQPAELFQVARTEATDSGAAR
jgi:hypothetical protein